MTLALRCALALGGVALRSSSVFARPAPRNLQRDALLRSYRFLAPSAQRIRTFVSSPANRRVRVSGLSRRVSAATATGLNFQFVGYTADQQATLQNFLSQNLANISAVWGDPAPEQAGQTLTINNVSGQATYFPPLTSASGAGSIDFGYVSTAAASDNQFALLELVLRAYQGPRVPAFDFTNGSYVEPYLYGASEAAALQIVYRAQGSPANFDPTFYAAYVLPVYDTFNSPALGNAFIYSPDNTDLAISDFRLAMAQAAFTKIAVENPNFFRAFNAALYARGAARTPISTDDLEGLVAGIVPTVEGVPFRAWVREQGALNARVTTGDKLYLAVLPVPFDSTTDEGSGLNLFAQAFTTSSNGSEAPLSGNASLNAFDETGRNINAYSSRLSSSNVLYFGDATTRGQATYAAYFQPWSSPAPARVTLAARLNAVSNGSVVEARTVFPYGVAGTTTSAASFYGATLSASGGTLLLSSNGSAAQSVPITRGTFAATLPYPSGARVITTISDGTRTVTRNTAWLIPGASARSVAFLLDGVGSNASSSLSLNTANGNLKMIAFPLRPFARDEAQALGADPSSLALARYRPNLSPSGVTSSGGLAFGVDGSRYEIYPHISQGPEAGSGYWILVPSGGLNTNVAGTFPPANQTAEVELKGGWNQIGVPRASSVSALGVKVRYGGSSAVSLAEAQSRGWIAPGVWRYDGTNGYTRVDVSGGVLQPWEGYWVFASPPSGVSLVFDPGASSGLRSSALASAPGEWSLKLLAQGAASRDASASFGVSKAAVAARPPVAARQISVYFPPTSNAASAGSGDAQGMLPNLKLRNTWHFVVDGAAKGERVTLGWSTLAAPPRFLRLFLRDDATGARVEMRTTRYYSFTSNGAPHRFSVLSGFGFESSGSAPSS